MPGLQHGRHAEARRPRPGARDRPRAPLDPVWEGLTGRLIQSPADGQGVRCMRVLLVCHRYPPDLGGAEAFAASLARALSRLGHTVTVLASTDAPDRSHS